MHHQSWLAVERHGWQLGFFILGALGVGALVLGMLTLVPPKYRKHVVMLVTFIGGLFFSLEFLLPHQPFWQKGPLFLPAIGKGTALVAHTLSTARPALSNWEIVIGSFAILLGIWNLFQIHGRAVAKLTKDWYNSLAFFVSFFAIVIAGFWKDAGNGSASKICGSLYNILFVGFLTSLNATMFSLIAFYIVSAAYRAFRIRSLESGLMMAAAAIVMLALVPIGASITAWLPDSLSFLKIDKIGYWILVSPNMAVQRAIALGVAVGFMAMGLRIWLSLERGSFFDRQL